MEENKKEQLDAVRLRQSKQKKAIIEQLKKVPVINVACARAVVGRASFYRWQQEDDDFKKAIEEAMAEGEAFINDMSESQVINLIKEKNWPAISFWLKHHHPKYAPKIEVVTNIKQEELNEEQEATVRKALKLAFPVLPDNQNDTANNESKNKQSNSESKPDAESGTEPAKLTTPAS